MRGGGLATVYCTDLGLEGSSIADDRAFKKLRSFIGRGHCNREDCGLGGKEGCQGRLARA
jgi:hypothetical protein